MMRSGVHFTRKVRTWCVIDAASICDPYTSVTELGTSRRFPLYMEVILDFSSSSQMFLYHAVIPGPVGSGRIADGIWSA